LNKINKSTIGTIHVDDTMPLPQRPLTIIPDEPVSNVVIEEIAPKLSDFQTIQPVVTPKSSACRLNLSFVAPLPIEKIINDENDKKESSSSSSSSDESDFLEDDSEVDENRYYSQYAMYKSLYSKCFEELYEKPPKWRVVYERTGQIDVKFRGATKMGVKLDDVRHSGLKFIDTNKTSLDVDDTTNKLKILYESKRHRFINETPAPKQINNSNFKRLKMTIGNEVVVDRPTTSSHISNVNQSTNNSKTHQEIEDEIVQKRIALILKKYGDDDGENDSKEPLSSSTKKQQKDDKVEEKKPILSPNKTVKSTNSSKTQQEIEDEIVQKRIALILEKYGDENDSKKPLSSSSASSSLKKSSKKSEQQQQQSKITSKNITKPSTSHQDPKKLDKNEVSRLVNPLTNLQKFN
jgi:hypothetical protein